MHIFISYAKADTYNLAIRLRDELRKLPGVTVWVDETLEPGESWATQIQEEIDAADYVIVLLSPDVNRPISGKQNRSFVLNEIDYAQQESKTIIPIMAQKTRMPVQLAGVQYINFVDDQDAALSRLIHRLVPPAGISVSDVLPAPPMVISVKSKSVTPPTVVKSPLYRRPIVVVPVFAIILIAVLALILTSSQPTIAITPTLAALIPPNTATDPPTVTMTATLPSTATEAPLPTPTQTLKIAFIAQALDANATFEQATRDAEATDASRATAYEVGTQILRNQTLTATYWTATPTPNITASIEAFRTEVAGTAAAQYFEGLTTTALSWTVTPTVTQTPTLTLPPTPTATNTFTFTPTLILSPTPLPVGYTGNPVTHNADWTSQYQTFDGYEMALVPVGCFMMGSTNGQADETPVNKQCFNQPFWMDRYEITNRQYGSTGTYKGDQRPRDSVTWFEARDFCASRNARLPSESEWEYSARGPDDLIYPWGNTFLSDNVAYLGNTRNQTANVGSRPAGASWVGALDMSGNLWEWVSSIYRSYPYSAMDGREINDDIASHVLRGGSRNDKPPVGLRGADRLEFPPSQTGDVIGFRCARDY